MINQILTAVMLLKNGMEKCNNAYKIPPKIFTMHIPDKDKILF